MSLSRRGFTAAGLLAAVVVGTGVFQALDAGAAENPAPIRAATARTAPAVARPPAQLPWGGKPKAIKRAKAGASTEAVAAAGADAAPADTSGATRPVAKWAPKGRAPISTTTARVAPPDPPATGDEEDGENDGVYYSYGVGTQFGETEGTWANIHVTKPEVGANDIHSLAEITVQSADESDAVEVGWMVSRGVNGDADPHLFVFRWIDDQPGCYNACGWTQYSSTVKPGDTLPVEGQKRFGIQFFEGNWWVAYNSEWIGYFSGSLWGNQWTKGGVTQWFGEVAAGSASSCTDMGNGEFADSSTASRVGSISQTNGPEPVASVRTRFGDGRYSTLSLSDRTFRFGGPGSGPC